MALRMLLDAVQINLHYKGHIWARAAFAVHTGVYVCGSPSCVHLSLDQNKLIPEANRVMGFVL